MTRKESTVLGLSYESTHPGRRVCLQRCVVTPVELSKNAHWYGATSATKTFCMRMYRYAHEHGLRSMFKNTFLTENTCPADCAGTEQAYCE